MWEDGCIIRSSVLNKIYGYLDQMPLEDVLFKELTTHKIKSLSKTVCFGAMGTIPLPVFTSTLNYYSSLSSNNLPANLIQLQREYFGSHGLERKNNPRVSFHISEIFSNS